MTVSFPVGDIGATFLRLPGFDPGDAGFLILPGQLRFHKTSIVKNGSLHSDRAAPGLHARRPQGRPGAHAFTVILVDKDGGIKLKRNDQVRLEEIFRLIDSMPMRQDEMRQKGRKF